MRFGGVKKHTVLHSRFANIFTLISNVFSSFEDHTAMKACTCVFCHGVAATVVVIIVSTSQKIGFWLHFIALGELVIIIVPEKTEWRRNSKRALEVVDGASVQIKRGIKRRSGTQVLFMGFRHIVNTAHRKLIPIIYHLPLPAAAALQ